jgi:hypothetical protein
VYTISKASRVSCKVEFRGNCRWHRVEVWHFDCLWTFSHSLLLCPFLKRGSFFGVVWNNEVHYWVTLLTVGLLLTSSKFVPPTLWRFLFSNTSH